jgi:uncharacterized protein (DUF697 family)
MTALVGVNTRLTCAVQSDLTSWTTIHVLAAAVVATKRIGFFVVSCNHSLVPFHLLGNWYAAAALANWTSAFGHVYLLLNYNTRILQKAHILVNSQVWLDYNTTAAVARDP